MSQRGNQYPLVLFLALGLLANIGVIVDNAGQLVGFVGVLAGALVAAGLISVVGDFYTDKIDNRLIRIERELEDEAGEEELISEIEAIEIEEEELGIIEFEAEIKDLAFMQEVTRYTEILEEAGFY